MQKFQFFFFLPLFAGALAMLTLSACSTPPAAPPVTEKEAPVVHYQPASWTTLPGWSQDDLTAAWPAWQVECQTLLKKESTQPIWKTPCQSAVHVDGARADAVRHFFETHFDAYQIVLKDGQGGKVQSDSGLITGYYEPLLNGSRTRNAGHPHPLYARPDDLLIVELSSLYPELAGKRVRGRLEGNKVVPYWSRAEIENGKNTVKAKPLVYVDDAMDTFFLQVQGSGRVRLGDGSIVRLGYADQNGHPYKAVGSVLVARGELTRDDVSMQTIRAWGHAHPQALPSLLDENPSYVFFREIPPPPAGSLEARIDGPTGSLGVPLLAQRTVAVDRNVIPLGAPVFLDTATPKGAPLQRLTLAQDTGGAIRGALRADFFWGTGAAAGEQAGAMKSPGRLWLLWPKGAPLPGKPPGN